MIAGWVLRNKLLLGIILVAGVSSAILVVTIYCENNPSNYNKSIVRNADTLEEENALLTAENINYADIFDFERFTVLGNVSAIDFPGHTFANFIDAEVVNFYDGLFENLKPGEHTSVTFNYSAEVFPMDEIQVVYDPYPENTEYNVDTARVRISSSNGEVLDEYGALTRYAYGDSSGIHEVQANATDFEFSNCYAVKMNFYYWEFGKGDNGGIGFAPFAFSEVHQTVIIDENLTPLFICVKESHDYI